MRNDPGAQVDRPRRVLIVDDHPLVAVSLSAILDGEPDLELCCVAEDAAAALEVLAAEGPDVAVVDLGLPADRDGVELIRTIRQRGHRLPLLVFSACEDPVWIRRALVAGANGFLNKGERLGEVVAALRRVLAGEVVISRELEVRLLPLAAKAGAAQPEDLLSTRELDIYRLIGRGFGTRAIADELHVSVSTVETHQRNIRKKLDMPSIRDLVRHAVRWHERGEV